MSLFGKVEYKLLAVYGKYCGYPVIGRHPGNGIFPLNLGLLAENNIRNF